MILTLYVNGNLKVNGFHLNSVLSLKWQLFPFLSALSSPNVSSFSEYLKHFARATKLISSLHTLAPTCWLFISCYLQPTITLLISCSTSSSPPPSHQLHLINSISLTIYALPLALIVSVSTRLSANHENRLFSLPPSPPPHLPRLRLLSC